MRALSHSGRPCAPGTPLACCLKGRYSVAVPSGGGGTGLSSQRWRTSKVFVPSSSTLRLICLRATALLSCGVLADPAPVSISACQLVSFLSLLTARRAEDPNLRHHAATYYALLW